PADRPGGAWLSGCPRDRRRRERRSTHVAGARQRDACRMTPPNPTLHSGSTGPDVRRLQRILVMIKVLDYTQIDGTFGPKTEAAVREFQQGEGLTVDGVVGPATWGALPPAPNTPQLARGAHGATVTALQEGLKKFGGAGSATDPGAIDGDFGPRTESAVRAY